MTEMTILFLRVFFISCAAVVGYQIGDLFGMGAKVAWYGAAVGSGVSFVVVLFEFSFRNVSVRGLSAGVFGLIFGLIMAKMVTDAMTLIHMDEKVEVGLRLSVLLVFSYLGMIIAMRGKDEFKIVIPYVKFDQQDEMTRRILMDTSAIIDGRILDICQTKFIEGTFIVPRFVLKELQDIADSALPLKRNRGRRGLDVLNKLRHVPQIKVKIHEEDFPEISAVDGKLVKLAKVLDARVLTNDYNLNRVAELDNIKVLNINDLANAVKPVVLPGESLETKLIKEGREYNQAVGYLGDGTMVVVENSRHLIGQTVQTVVTSVLQTSAGRMIFAKVGEEK